MEQDLAERRHRMEMAGMEAARRRQLLESEEMMSEQLAFMHGLRH